jgi:hypothetical protein
MPSTFLGSGQWFTRVENVAVVLVKGPSTPATVVRLRDEIVTLHRAVGPLGFYYVVDDNRAVALVDETTRAAISGMIQVVRDKIAASAIVVSIGGFTGAGIRALISTLSLAARAKSPTRVFDDEASAVAWLPVTLKRRGCASPSGEDLLAATQTLHAQVKPAVAASP